MDGEMDDLFRRSMDPQIPSPPSSSTASPAWLRWFASPTARTALVLLGLATLLLAPRLSTEGLWDPHEVRLLEGTTEPFDPHTLWQAKSFRAQLPQLPVVLGARLLGVNELGGRAPMLALGLLALLALYGLGRWLMPRDGWGVLFTGLVMLSSPLFFLSARHISATLPPMLFHTLAVFGLAALAWPRPERRGLSIAIGLSLALPGLAGGLLCSGTLVGVVAPIAAVVAALALSGGPWLPQLLLGGACGGLLVPAVRLVLQMAAAPPGWRFGIAGACLLVAALGILVVRDRRTLGLSVLAAVVAIGLLPGISTERLAGYVPWLGGVLHWPPSREPQVDTLLKGLGFYLFPWSGLVPLAFVALFSQLDPAPAPADADAATSSEVSDGSAAYGRFALLLPLAWFATTYVLTTLQCALVADVSFPAAPALALLLGPYLARLLREPETGGAASGLCAALCIVMVGRDFFFAPEQLMSAHLTDTLRWPAPLSPIGEALSACGIVLGAVFGLAIAARSPWRRRLLGLGIVLSLAGAGAAAHGLAPALARHVSYRGLYTRYQKLGGGALALYGVQQSSGRIYGQNSTQLYSLPDVMSFLFAKPTERSFVIVGASELAAVDREARIRGSRYFVVDDSNAQFLLLTNRLLPGEDDLNPLRRFISDTEPHPQKSLSPHITFDDKLELIGYDIPNEVNRGEELLVRLYFKVLAPIPVNYRIFLHFDGMGTRWNGDHAPLNGKYATNYWSPGTYVTDEHRIPVSRMNQPAGYYQIFTGFWPGGDGARLKVTAGPHEADLRVRLGVLQVK